jgi:hypothetical protein
MKKGDEVVDVAVCKRAMRAGRMLAYRVGQ